jgi:hypothetical protein
METPLSTNPLCLEGLGVERDAAGPLSYAEVPAGGGLSQEQESRDADELRKGQFERMPRIGARGFGPSVLRHDIFVDGFSGDFAMSKGKYMRRVPGSHILFPRPMPGCWAASAADASRLPPACDRNASLIAGHGQGYVSVGRTTAQLLAQLPDRDVLRAGAPWRTCALQVAPPGDGGERLASSADALIRVGLPLRGGERATVRVLGAADVARLVREPGAEPLPGATHRALYRTRLGQVGMVRSILLLLAQSEVALNGSLAWQRSNPGAGVAFADADLLQHTLDAHAGTQPSAAFVALALAAERCERVLLFGFSCEAAGGRRGGAEVDASVREEERVARAFLAQHRTKFAFAPTSAGK